MNNYTIHQQVVVEQQEKLDVGPNWSNNDAHKQNKKHKNKKPFLQIQETHRTLLPDSLNNKSAKHKNQELKASNSYENKKKLVCTSYLEVKAYNNFLQSELQRPKAFDIIEH